MATTIKEKEERLVNQVDQQRLMEFTENVSKEVRLSGSAEEMRAFRYVEETLKGFGLTTELFFSDAYISLPVESQLSLNSQEYKSITHSMAISTPEEGVEGELVYAGTMLNPNFNEVQGKVVLIDGLAIPGAVKQAQEAGARAAVFINATYTHEMIVSPVWGNPTPETAELLPEIPVVSVNFEDGQTMKNEVQKNNKDVFIKTTVDTGWRKIPTLIAEIKANKETDHFVLYSGHIDSWHYGAMDNGSANGTMIEVARLLSQEQENLDRTLRFAFWSGHSHGRYAGSAWYCDEHWEDLHENCVLHVNIDSVGAKGSTILTEGNCMKETKDLAHQVIQEQTDELFEGSRFGRAGDQSFWGTGTPSIFMGLSEQPKSSDPASEAFSQLFGAGRGGGFGWWWHTTEDTLDKIDPEKLQRDCQIYLSVIYRALTDKVLPINHLEAVKELREVLLDYDQKSGASFSLIGTLDRIKTLEEVMTKLYSKVAHRENNEEASVINDTIMELSRILVPLNYVNGDSFDHDLAMKQEPLPSLSKLSELAYIEPYSDEYFQYITFLKRKVNRVNATLKKAINVTKSAIEKLPNQ